MTRTIRSASSNKHYFLTIDEQGHAIGCTCKDRYYRQHTCKHMSELDEQFARALAFAQLRAQYDVRSQAQRDARLSAYLNYEMSIGVL